MGRFLLLLDCMATERSESAQMLKAEWVESGLWACDLTVGSWVNLSFTMCLIVKMCSHLSSGDVLHPLGRVQVICGVSLKARRGESWEWVESGPQWALGGGFWIP